MAKLPSVKAHVLKMIEWIERLAVLGVELPIEMSTELILQSLLDSFSQFIVNFNMNNIHASLPELLYMLITTEGNLQKEKPQVLFVGGTNKKRKVVFASKRGKVMENYFKNMNTRVLSEPILLLFLIHQLDKLSIY